MLRLKIILPLLILVPIFAAAQASSIPSARVIQTDELLKMMEGKTGEKPLVIQVGSRVLYEQAHIPGSEYIGPASSEEGVEQLRKRVEPLSKAKLIVLYCGCCPWSHCPNVKPAYDLLAGMGFMNVKVLYIANNFGTDWVDKGYAVTKGH
jgi:thiosulfate/3-mercaptopyruvate sulfurtransferase